MFGVMCRPPFELLHHNRHRRAQEIQLRLHVALASDGLGCVVQQAPYDLLRNARLNTDRCQGVPKGAEGAEIGVPSNSRSAIQETFTLQSSGRRFRHGRAASKAAAARKTRMSS